MFNQDVIRCLLIAACVAIPVARCAPVDGVEADKLLGLMDTIKAMQRPSVADVSEAFKEYVVLHKRQSQLAKQYQPEANSAVPSDIEVLYKQVSRILQMPELKVISEDLFSTISDKALTEDGRLIMNARTEECIAKAIDEIQF